jgi:hypothetical protein
MIAALLATEQADLVQRAACGIPRNVWTARD